ALRARKDKVVDSLASHLARSCKDRKVAYVQTRAAFADGSTLQLDNGDRVRFRNCIVATGSLPARPAAFNIDSPLVVDSTGARALEDVPPSLLVVGGGYIGLEMGTVYAALGSRVTVVEMTGSLLPGVDADLVRPLAGRLKTLFHKIHLNTLVKKVEAAE